MINISIRTCVRILIVNILFLTFASTAGQVCCYFLGHPDVHGLVRLFYLDAEANIPSWYQSMTLLLCALLLTVAAQHERDARTATHWRWLSLIFCLLSMDEAASLHEMLGEALHNRLGTHGVLHFAWVIGGGAFVIAFAAANVRFLLQLPRTTALRFLLAGALYVGGALGMDLLEGRYVELHGQHNIGFAIMTTVEEVLEMCGVALFLYSLLRHLQGRCERSALRIID